MRCIPGVLVDRIGDALAIAVDKRKMVFMAGSLSLLLLVSLVYSGAVRFI
jgi:hypothetical protein